MLWMLRRGIDNSVELLRAAFLCKGLCDSDSLGLEHGLGLGQNPQIR